MAAQLFVGNDNDVYLQGYRLASTGAAVTDALPSFTVYGIAGYDMLGRPIQGAALSGLTNVAMAYVDNSQGDYRGLIPGTAVLTEWAPYFVLVTFANYNDSFGGWFTAANRISGIG